MAFPAGWLRQCKLTVQHGQVTADQVNFPVLVTEASLPSEMMTSGGGNASQSDGGDIRFSSDSAGSTQLPCEVSIWTQNANPALAKAEIWVKVPNIYTATDADIYVWYSAGGGQTQPAANTTYGRNNAWDANHRFVAHCSETAASTTITDSTGVNATVTSARNASLITAAGKVGNAFAFNGSSDMLATAFSQGNTFTLECWEKRSSNANNEGLVCYQNSSGVRQELLQASTHRAAVVYNGGNFDIASTVTVDDGAWHHLVATTNGTTATIYVDGAAVAKANFTAVGNQGTNVLRIGAIHLSGGTDTAFFGGSIDEARASDSVRSATWISTSYNSMSAPGSFLIAGTPSGVSSGTTLSPGAASLTLTKYAAALRLTLPLSKATLTITGRAPALVSTLPVPKAALTLTKYAAALCFSVQPAKASLALTKYAAALRLTVPVPKASLALTGYVPSILGINVTLYPSYAALALSGKMPTVLVSGPPGTSIHRIFRVDQAGAGRVFRSTMFDQHSGSFDQAFGDFDGVGRPSIFRR